MAPILKEADTPATATANTTIAPSAPAAKSPNETPARPQPVPLEIPVTVSGARTVEGSDKREPFVETTQTVLVFPHGAVIRIATPLAPGQLVFLTNEKTKKEVVCQVVKSKSGGSANGYVELQFTEPAPAFWGLRLPGTVAPPPATAPAVPRPLLTTPAPKVAPATPRATPVPAPPKPASIPPAPPVIRPEAAIPPQPVAPITSLPSVSLVAPAPKRPETAPIISVPAASSPDTTLVSVPPPSPLSSETLSASVPQAPKPLLPPPPAGPAGFSREIESLLAVPQAPESSKPAAPTVATPSAVTSSPATEELKQQAARLQDQLSSMLFTQAPSAPGKSPVAPPELKADGPVTEVANKILEIAQEEPKPVTVDVTAEPKPETKSEPKPVISARPPALNTLSAKDEEVEIPAWLRPLSQHVETVTEAPAPAESTDIASSTSDSKALSDAANAESSIRPEAAVFGGQLLGGDSSPGSAAASGSKKGRFLGLAAVVLLGAGGAWYYRQIQPTSATPTTQVSSSPLTAEPEATPAPAEQTLSTTPSRPATATAADTANSTAVHNPVPAATAPAPAPPEARRNAETRNPAPVEEPAKKPALGRVHLAAPVVRGSTGANASGESLPSIDASMQNPGADALADVATHKGPKAPIPIGGDVKPAQLIKSVPPIYPQLARTQRISGNVALDALIDASGNVAQLNVISGPPLLHKAALEAVKQWKYTPAQLNGTPTATHLTVTVQFRTQ